MIKSLYEFEKLIKVNGPAYRGAKMPAFNKLAINESKIPDNMRLKHYQVDILDENSIQLYWQTQEPFTTEDAEKALEEIERAIKAIVKANEYTERLSVHVTFECRDGADEGYEDFTFPVNNKIKKENINIRESLNRLDAATCNDYDLLNTYNSVALNEERKATLAKMLREHVDAKKIARFLINESQSKDLKESLNESDDFDWSIYDDYGYDDYEDDWDHANTYGGDLTDCPICGSRLSYDEDGGSYCNNCGEDAYWLAQERRERDKKLDEDETSLGQSSHTGSDIKHATSDILNAIADETDDDTRLKQIGTLIGAIPDEKADEVVDTIKELFGELKLNAEARKKAKEAGLEPDNLESIGDICDFVLVKFNDEKFTGKIKNLIMIIVQLVFSILGMIDGHLPIFEGIGLLINAIIGFIPNTLVVKIAGLPLFVAALAGSKIVRGAQAKKRDKVAQESEVKEDFSYEDSEFFTKEEIADFAEKVCDHVNETFNEHFDVQEYYLTDNKLEVILYNDELGEFTGTKKIDMRRIRKISDLDKYVLDIAADIIEEIKEVLIDSDYHDADEDELRKMGVFDESLTEDSETANSDFIIENGVLIDYRRAYEHVTIPDNVTSIGYQAFKNCESLTSIVIPDSVTNIGKYAFEDCTNLTSVTIGNSVTRIGECAFGGCTSLASIEIPSSVEIIDGWAFSYCDSLKSITIGNGVTSIGEEAFSNCESLTNVTIGDSVETIGKHAFAFCTSLTNITIPDSVTNIKEAAFLQCTSLTSITIPNSVTWIGSAVFMSCTSLESVTIGNSVTHIGYSAFNSCSALTNIIIPNSVTEISNKAFKNCESLKSIVIPDSVTSIGSSAFEGCSSLTIYCEVESKPSGWLSGWNGNCNVVWGYNKSNLTEDSDNDGPYSYKETEAELQSLTQNWTVEKDQLKCGYDEEKNYGMEILSKHGYECNADRQGGWWIVDYWKQPIKENKSDIIDSQNEETTFDVLDENEEVIKTFNGRDYDKLIEFVNTNPDACFVEKHETVEVDGFGYEEPEMQVFSYYVFDRSEDDSLTYEMLREGLKESAKTWHDAYKEFQAIVDKYFPNEDEIESKVYDLYMANRLNPAYEEAYERWLDGNGEPNDDLDEDKENDSFKYDIEKLSNLGKYFNVDVSMFGDNLRVEGTAKDKNKFYEVAEEKGLLPKTELDEDFKDDSTVISLITNDKLSIVERDVIPDTTSFIAEYIEGDSQGTRFLFVLADNKGTEYTQNRTGEDSINTPTEILEINGQDNVYFIFDLDSSTLGEAWSWEPEFKTEDGWTEEDIARWKEIDWAPLLKQHIGEVAVPEDNFMGKAVLYGDGYKPQYKEVKFVKKLHSNPIYPPNYTPEENPFPEHCGPMYDGTKHNGLNVHDRYETWANYDMLSR